MTEIEKLNNEIKTIRHELKNLRQEHFKQKALLNKQVADIHKLFDSNINKKQDLNKNVDLCKISDEINFNYNMVPIGRISSCFSNKNGIPRQSTLCPTTKATLTLNKSIFTNPAHSLIGLEKYSFIWLLFLFHKNTTKYITKTKVHPPRLNGDSLGVFATRSPHRLNPIGLSLIKLDKIEGDTLYLSGVDILDGTPVLDIKPYISSYDIPNTIKFELKNKQNKVSENEKETILNTSDIESSEISNRNIDNNCSSKVKNNYSNKKLNLECANELNSNLNFDIEPINVNSHCILSKELEINFTKRALSDLEHFHNSSFHPKKCIYCLDFIDSWLEAKKAIQDILQNDPRSVYRKNHCCDKLYYFSIDNLHVTCWFDDNLAEILKIKPLRTHSD